MMHGRVRRSTVVVALVFVATLVLYVLVRPAPTPGRTTPIANPTPTTEKSVASTTLAPTAT
jgi:hypothetical protein